MRIAFWLLLLANLLLLAWAQGMAGSPEAGREPERLVRQMAPEKLRILGDASAVAATPPVAAAVEKPTLACKRIVGLSADEAKSLSEAAHVRGGWEAQTQPLPPVPMHWVAIGDLSSSALAEKKKTELRQLGITESEIVPGVAPGSFAVSLGLFREPQRAQEFLQKLTAKGVRSARIIPRDTPPDKFAVELRAPVDQLAALLPDLSTALPGAVTQDCSP